MNKRFFFLLLIIGFLISCSSRYSTKAVTALIRSTLKLSVTDKLEILGTTEESKSVLLVKFKVNDLIINVKLRKFKQGWQFEEIQDSSGDWAPATTKLNHVMWRDKIRQSQIEMSKISDALINYVTDKTSFPEMSGEYDENCSIFRAAYPQYIKSRPIKDPWGYNFIILCGRAIDGHYGISGSAPDDFMIASRGMDGQFDRWNYDQKNPDAGKYLAEMDSPIEADNDIVILNGYHIRGPKINK